MAIIITDMNMPKRCFECKLKLNGACAYLMKPTGGVNSKDRLPDCPLKSADDMVAEIKGLEIHGNARDVAFCKRGLEVAVDIIHKYTKGKK